MINTPTTESESKISNPVVTDQLRYRKQIFDKLQLEGKDKMWYAHYKYMDIVNELEPLFKKLAGDELEPISELGNNELSHGLPISRKKEFYNLLRKWEIGVFEMKNELQETYGIAEGESKKLALETILTEDSDFSSSLNDLKDVLSDEEKLELENRIKSEIEIMQIGNSIVYIGDAKTIDLFDSIRKIDDKTIYDSKILTKKSSYNASYNSGDIINKQGEKGKIGMINIKNNSGNKEESQKHERKHSIDWSIGKNYQNYSKRNSIYENEKVLAMEILAFDRQGSGYNQTKLKEILLGGYIHNTTGIANNEYLYYDIYDGYSVDRTKKYSFSGTEEENKIRKQVDGFCKSMNKLIDALYGLKKIAINFPELGLDDSKINVLLSITPASMRSKLKCYYSDIGKNIVDQKAKEGYIPFIQYDGPTLYFKTKKERKEFLYQL